MIDTTGHATHFLKRLERTNPRETELALTLYRDSQAVALLLHYIQVPEHYERIALSLSAGDKGPFIVVGRDGSFITCLGPGMHTDGLYKVNFERLVHYRSKSAEFSNRIESAKEMDSQHGVESLIEKLISKGHAVSREDFMAVSVLQPVFKGEFLRLLAEILISYDDQLRVLRRLKRSNKQNEEALRTLWETYQMIGHLVLLSLVDGRTLIPDEAVEDLFQLLFFVYDVGTIHVASRALWAVGRVGKPLVHACKKAVREPITGPMLFFGLSGLAALGLRHRRLKTEVAKLFKFDESSIRNLSDEPLKYLLDMGIDPYGFHAKLINRPDEITSEALEHLRFAAYENLQHLEKPSKYGFVSAEDVPVDIAVPWALVLPGDIREDRSLCSWLLSMIPYLARTEAEMFYLPRDLLDCMDWSWHPDLSLHLLKQDRQTNPERKPVVFTEKVGRNEPCPCGSGKKFKKCCLK